MVIFPEMQSRAFYRQGRIDDSDILAALVHDPQLQADQIVCTMNDRFFHVKELYRVALLFDLDPLSVSQLNWHIEELDALDTMQADVPE